MQTLLPARLGDTHPSLQTFPRGSTLHHCAPDPHGWPHPRLLCSGGFHFEESSLLIIAAWIEDSWGPHATMVVALKMVGWFHTVLVFLFHAHGLPSHDFLSPSTRLGKGHNEEEADFLHWGSCYLGPLFKETSTAIPISKFGISQSLSYESGSWIPFCLAGCLHPTLHLSLSGCLPRFTPQGKQTEIFFSLTCQEIWILLIWRLRLLFPQHDMFPPVDFLPCIQLHI